MARKPSDVLEALVTKARALSPRVDTTGLIEDAILAPLAVELASVEELAEYVRRVLQLRNPEFLLASDLDAVGQQVGITRSSGVARVRVTFHTTERPAPGSNLDIPAGTTVSTRAGLDGRTLLFRTAARVLLPEASFNAFYVQSRQRYEFSTYVLATAAGSEYNVAPETLSEFLTPVPGVAGVINYAEGRGGRDPLDQVAYAARISGRLVGYNRDTAGGLQVLLDPDAVPALEDLVTVSSTDTNRFKRLADVGRRVATDVYVLGDDPAQQVHTIVSSGGEDTFVLPVQPVTEVTAVIVSESAVPFTVVFESDPRVEGSTSAGTAVILDTITDPLDTVVIRYTSNAVVTDSQALLSAVTRESFGDDVMVREGTAVGLEISVSMDSSGAAEVNEGSVRAFLLAYLRDPAVLQRRQRAFISEIDPVGFTDRLQDALPAARKIRVHTFRRLDEQAVTVYPRVLFRTGEYPDLSISELSIQVAQ